MTVLDRRAARVVLVDGADRTLLLRGGDPARPGLRWWFTPGGGLNDGETSAEGAARELYEETGLHVTPADLGEPVWHQVTRFSYDNQMYRQEQDFYLVRVPEWEVDTTGFDIEEQRSIDDHRWWTADELDATSEAVYPENLGELLRRLTAPSASAAPSGSAAPSASAAPFSRAVIPSPAAVSPSSRAVTSSPAAVPPSAAAPSRSAAAAPSASSSAGASAEVR